MATTIYISSLPGIHQNSNLMTGGGTDDTAVVQAALNAGPYPLILIQDGVSLVTGLSIPSNVTLRCNANCGFYLANSSNGAILYNANRSASTRTDANITIDGGFYNGNKTNQSGVSEASGNPMAGFQFYGITNLTIENLEVYDASAWAVGIGNATNVLVNGCSLTATTPFSNLNTDGVDIRGNSSNITLSNLVITAGDDAIALNSIDYNTSAAGPYVDDGGNISNVKIFNITFMDCFGGIDVLVSDLNATYGISNVYIWNLQGTVQNFALYLNRDLYDLTSPTPGSCSGIWCYNSLVAQAGTPYGGKIPAGLYLVDETVSDIRFSNVGNGLLADTNVSLPTTNGTVVSLFLNGTNLGAKSGITSVNLEPPKTGLSFLQSTGGNGSVVGETISQTYASNNTSGSLLLAWALWYESAGTPTSLSVTGGAGNTWVPLIIDIAFDPNRSFGLWACYNNQISGSKITVAATANGSGLTLGGSVIGIAEYANQRATPLDSVSSLYVGEAVTITNLSPVTTSKSNELVIVGGTGAGTITPFLDCKQRLNTAGVILADIGVPGAAPAAAGATITPGWSQTSPFILAFSAAFFSQTSGNANVIPTYPSSGIIKAQTGTHFTAQIRTGHGVALASQKIRTEIR